MELFGLKKKRRPWGTVYDSVTKRPLDPVYVSLIDLSTNKEIDYAITDLDGRYGFLVVPGSYKITVEKTDYTSPSVKMKGKSFDEVYDDLYFGETIVIEKEGEILTKNIPMDSLSFNWNEFAKAKLLDVNSFTKTKYITWAKISKPIFIIGAIFSFIALILAPGPYNFIVAILYVFAYILNFIIFKTKKSGIVKEKNTGVPLSFAVLEIFREEGDSPFVKKITDIYGSYYALLPNGKYFIKIKRKEIDETYTEIFKTQLIDVSNGIINQDFEI